MSESGLKIQFASDLHVEFDRGGVPWDIIVPTAPVLALVGDIGITQYLD